MQAIFDGAVLNEGKTKVIGELKSEPDKVMIVSKDDITAGDGAKHDVMEGKAASANQTACNNFRLLADCGVPVAFDEQVGPVAFKAPKCEMLPYEVVLRREAHGSYLKRNPHLEKGHVFPKLLVEFYLKTNGRKWKQHDLPCDDPFMSFDAAGGEIILYQPSKPLWDQEPFLVLKEDEVFSKPNEAEMLCEMAKIAKRAFYVMEKCWQQVGRTLVDCKVEFGLAPDGMLLLADVIDNDSWRVLENGSYIDKQVYRDGGSLDSVADNYRRVAAITGGFRVPPQRVIIWTGSVKDDVTPIEEAVKEYSDGCIPTAWEACSIHKEPVRAGGELTRLVQETPNSVIIALIGMSNGAGPTLSACTTVPVITIPASIKSFQDDVWSCLRTPSFVPVSTVLSPANAALAALEILALNNPQIYMLLRERLEERAHNVADL